MTMLAVGIGMIVLIAGFGWCIPIWACVFLKQCLWPKERSTGTVELELLAEWVIAQCVLGVITIVTIPILYFLFDTTVVNSLLFGYTMVSVVSVCLVWAVALGKTRN